MALNNSSSDNSYRITMDFKKSYFKEVEFLIWLALLILYLYSYITSLKGPFSLFSDDTFYIIIDYLILIGIVIISPKIIRDLFKGRLSRITFSPKEVQIYYYSNKERSILVADLEYFKMKSYRRARSPITIFSLKFKFKNKKSIRITQMMGMSAENFDRKFQSIRNFARMYYPKKKKVCDKFILKTS